MRSLVVLGLCTLARSAAADDDPRDAFATTIDLHAGAMLLDLDDEPFGGGPIGGLAIRWIGTNLKSDVFGIAVVGDAEVGYAKELVGQLRVGVGLGVVQGWFSASMFAGGAMGSMARAASSDAFVGGNVAVTVRELVAVWVEGARAIGNAGPDHDRLELRVAVPERNSGSGWSWILGARYLAFGGVDANTGGAFVLTVGKGEIGSSPNHTF